MRPPLFIILALLILITPAEPALPIVLWHGVRCHAFHGNFPHFDLVIHSLTDLPSLKMGDSCCNPFSMGSITRMLQANIPGVYVHSLMIGNDILQDVANGFLMGINKQVDFVCNTVKGIPQLSKGFNAIGFSQGSQFLRAYVQRCNSPPVHNLVSIAGQHQGVFGIPHCPGPNITLCETMRRLLSFGAYIPWIQQSLVQAQYWHDAIDNSAYMQGNIWLPDINNAGPVKNETYRKNLMSLKNFVMIKNEGDNMVQPTESSWFGFYRPGQSIEIEPLRESKLYHEDWLGLKVMDQQKKLHFLSSPGDHLKFTETWFVQNVIKPFLNSTN